MLRPDERIENIGSIYCILREAFTRRSNSVNGTIEALLFFGGAILFMVLCWTFYLRVVRKVPQDEEWYDASEPEGADSDGALFIFPYGSLILGSRGIEGLVRMADFPDPVQTVLLVPPVVLLIIGFIGFTGAFGIPLPWPFVPRWVVDIRKAKRARRRERWQGKKTNRSPEA